MKPPPTVDAIGTPTAAPDDASRIAMERLAANPHMPPAAARIYRRVIARGLIQAQLRRVMHRSDVRSVG
jgi:hypothetical protein